MRESEINEKISAWFEPKPATLHINRDRHPRAGVYWSEKRVWKHDCYSTVENSWDPLDYFHSEDANARLVEAMPRVGLYHMANHWECSCRNDGTIRSVSTDPDRKTAVVLAFCKFAHIEVTL